MKAHSLSIHLRAVGLSFLGLIASCPLLHAADYQWDVNGSAADLGGTGTWNGANAFWDDLAAGANDGTDVTQAVTFSGSHSATFAGIAGTVTFASGPTTGAVTLTTPNYIFRGYANGTQNFNGLTTLPTSGITSYNQAANNNSFRFNGGVNLNGSSLAVRLRNSLNGGGPSTATGVITGAGGLILANDLPGTANTGRVVLSGANDYSGTTTLDGVILDANNATALGTSALTINSTAAANTTVIRNTSAGALTWANNNAMTWNGDFTFSANTTRTGSSSGTPRDLNMGTGNVLLTGNRIVTVTANTLTVGGVISDGGNAHSLTKEGAGSLFLDGNNTYTGDTSVNAGTLSLLEPYLEDTSSVSIGATAVLDLAFNGTDTVNKLFINGVQQTTGTWGSTESGATHIDDTHFTGAGTLTVTTAPDPLLVIASTVTETTNSAATALSIPLSNNGATQTLTVSAITIGGANAASFVLNSALPINIAPGGSATIDYTFTPSTGPGAYTATFDVTSNDLSQSPKTITLNVTDKPDPWIIASDTDFTNSGSAQNYIVSVSNDGSAKNLNLGTVTAGGFDAATVSNITAPSSILPGQTGDIQFTFTPDSVPGPYEFTLTIPSDDPGTPSKVITINILVKDPVIAVSTNAINLGILANAPGPQVQNITVINTGGAQNLVVENTTAITGASEFAITNTTFPITIPPGGSSNIEVTFTPGSGFGRFNSTLQIVSNDYDGTTPSIALTAFVAPAGVVAARFDFEPVLVSGSVVDSDDSTLAEVVLGDLVDAATGTGAVSAGNQTTSNRVIRTGINGNYLAFSSAREADAQTPLAAGGSNETTWTTFTIAPEAGGGAIDFTGGSAVVDTYANTDQGTNTAANWTLYYSTDSGSSWTSLGTSAGQSTASNGTKGPMGITWDLSSIGNQTAPVQFILDPVSTGSTNGTVNQRGVGFDNLIITAGSITPGVASNFETWAGLNGVTGGANGDSDKDGIPNLVEYALNLNINGSDGPPYSLTGQVISFTKRPEAVTNGDVTYAIQISSDLVAWTTVDPLDLEEGSATDPDSISYYIPPGDTRSFARLVVSQIP